MKAFLFTLALGTLFLESLTPQKSNPAITPVTDDPYSWLEEVAGEKALAWVKERNAESTKELAGGADETRCQRGQALLARAGLPRRGEAGLPGMAVRGRVCNWSRPEPKRQLVPLMLRAA